MKELRESSKRSEAVVELEVMTLRNLVDRRHGWLADPKNRMRSTYDAVRRDTMSLEYQLLELEQELRELKSTNH